MIVVTTPTGDIGARVLDGLLDAGRNVRVVLRNPTTLAEGLRRRVEVVEGSHSDETVIARALDGATSVFWLPPGPSNAPSAGAAYVAFSGAFCEALPHSTVTHVVGVSALGRGWSKPAGQVTASLKMDDRIGATGVAYRALACASLMDNLLRQADAIREQGAFYQPTPGDLQLPHVAKRDVADVASRLLLKPDWDDAKDIPLLGPADLTFKEMATTMSDVLNRSVSFHEMSMDQFAGFLHSTGASEGMTRAYVEMLTAKNEGMDTMHPKAPRDLTPTTFRDWCETELRPMLTSLR